VLGLKVEPQFYFSYDVRKNHRKNQYTKPVSKSFWKIKMCCNG